MIYLKETIVWTLFTWGMTALGAAAVLTALKPSKKFLDLSLGFAGGVMVAASFFSLIAPSVELSKELGMVPWIPAVVGFLVGGAFLKLLDSLLPHLHFDQNVPEGLKTHWKKTTLLIMAITLHNIPEGLAVGVAFGAASQGFGEISAAIALAFGIGLQNLPEGMAVSMPLRRLGLGPLRSFFWGQLSGAVEPVAAVLGILAVHSMRLLLPYALAFAAGAMIYVVVEELIPESQSSGNSDISTLGFMIGFALMMNLDLAFG